MKFNRNNYSSLIVEKYRWKNSLLIVNYILKSSNATEDISLSESIDFSNLARKKEPNECLTRLLVLSLSLSYYKLSCPKSIFISFPITSAEKRYLSRLIQNGLGEFAYTNNLPESLKPNIQCIKGYLKQDKSLDCWNINNQPLVPVGGGKDSIVTIEGLKEVGHVPTLFSVNKYKPIDDCIRVSGLNSINITRTLDQKIHTLNLTGAYNGHIPVTAINSIIGLITADIMLLGSVIFSNENSSNYGNLKWNNKEINHQWSKSLEFEKLLRDTLEFDGLDPDRYFSILRSYSEIEIAKKFSNYTKYFEVFRSCNTAFKLDKANRNINWCSSCPKCYFVFLILAPYIDKQKLIDIFGKNLFNDKSKLDQYLEITGLLNFKPFECVGDYEEAIQAFNKLSYLEEWSNDYIVKTIRNKFKNIISPLKSLNLQNFIPKTYNSFLENFECKKIGIWGTGKEGRALYSYLSKTHKYIAVVDEIEIIKPKYLLECTEFYSGKDSLLKLNTCDRIYVSPGISRNHSYLSNVNKNILSTSTSLFLDKKHNETIGITGTKGKSTTSNIIHHILNEIGIENVLAGNIGDPLIKFVDSKNIVIAELSSYQCKYVSTSPRISIITNLYEDHIDWHGNVEDYWKSKLNLIKNSEILICNTDTLNKLNKQIIANKPKIILNSDDLLLDEKQLITVPEYVKFRHNIDNLKYALIAVNYLTKNKYSSSEIISRLSKVQGLKHRLEIVSEKHNITWIDDCLSTTPESVIAGLEAYKDNNIILIIGGMDRGISYNKLIDYLIGNIHRIFIISIPSNGQKIMDRLAKLRPNNIYNSISLKDAVNYAKIISKGFDIVLLSPGAPSYDLYSNHTKKSREYINSINSL